MIIYSVEDGEGFDHGLFLTKEVAEQYISIKHDPENFDIFETIVTTTINPDLLRKKGYQVWLYEDGETQRVIKANYIDEEYETIFPSNTLRYQRDFVWVGFAVDEENALQIARQHLRELLIEEQEE